METTVESVQAAIDAKDDNTPATPTPHGRVGQINLQAARAINADASQANMSFPSNGGHESVTCLLIFHN